MDSDVSVREARAGDEAAIVALVQELAAAAGEFSPIGQEHARAYLATPGSHALLAHQGGQAIGLLSYSVRLDLYHAGPAAMIEELVVHREHRGQGVGSALMRDLLARLVALGCVEVSVTTMPDNEGAKRFYRSHGLVDEAVFLEKHFQGGTG